VNPVQLIAAPTDRKPLLVMEQIGKRFGATIALKDVSLTVLPGETVALIGENGAGKSTLMKVLSGAHSPDMGRMFIGGVPFRPSGPLDSRKAGVAMIYQELSLAPELSVEDNIMLGQEIQTAGVLRRGAQRERVATILQQLGHPDLMPKRLVRSLSIGAKQLVEIARALASNARVMIFDEPTSSLPKQDVDRLFSIIQQLQSQGMAIIYISHFLEEIRRVAHRFVVLRDGQPAGSGQLDATSDEQIVSLMAGRSVETLFPVVEHSIQEPVLEVRNLTGTSTPRDVSFTVRKGEVFGLFGLVGAGRTETLRHLFGLDAMQSGSTRLRGRALGKRPSSSIRAGVGFVSEDRKTEGLAQSMSIADNLTLSDLRPYSRFGLLKLGKRKVAVRDWMKQLRVKARGPEQPIGHLSGGNQQKVAIARVLHQSAELLLLDEPTRGIDVGTKAEIYRLIGELAAEGKSIVFVSSYLPELMAVCDTIGVMARGRLREVRPTSEWDEHEVLAVAITGDDGQ
jgi:ribose transport system ATP-binding protein